LDIYGTFLPDKKGNSAFCSFNASECCFGHMRQYVSVASAGFKQLTQKMRKND
jgi:hypothetical protein